MKYSGKYLRKIRAEKGVGRPPKVRPKRVYGALPPPGRKPDVA